MAMRGSQPHGEAPRPKALRLSDSARAALPGIREGGSFQERGAVSWRMVRTAFSSFRILQNTLEATENQLANPPCY